MSVLTIRTVIIIFSIVLLSACAGNKVRPDYDPDVDFSQYKSYRWKNDNENTKGQARNPFVHKAIVKEVNKVLMNKKYFKKEENEKSEFIVDYYLTIETRQRQSSTRVGFGTGTHSGSSSVGIGMSFPITKGTIEKHVTLVIEIRDSVKNSVTWRATGTDVFNESTAGQETKDRIRKSVNRILAEFPPIKKEHLPKK